MVEVVQMTELKAIIKDKVGTKHTTNNRAPNRKVIVPCAFADTAAYLYEQLKPWASITLRSHIARVSGGTRLLVNYDIHWNPVRMGAYSALLDKTVAAIVAQFTRKNAANLFTGRGGKLMDAQKVVKSNNDFELITWLVVK